MTVYVVPGVFGVGGQILDSNGKIANGSLVNTYAAGTTSAVATFTNSLGTVTAANPIVANADGRLPHELWQTGGTAIKIVLTDSLANTLGTYDNLTGINDPTAILTTTNNWTVGQNFNSIAATSITVSTLYFSALSITSLTVSQVLTSLIQTISTTNLVFGVSGVSTWQIHGTADSNFGALEPVVDIGVNLGTVSNRVATINVQNITASTLTASTLTISTLTVSTLTVSTLNLPNGVVYSSSYLPTLSNITNVSSSSSYQAQYLRLGSIVFVAGQFDLFPTTTVATVLRISIPIASNFGADSDCSGVAAAWGGTVEAVGIIADPGTDTAEINYTPTALPNRTYSFNFGYRVI